MRMIDGWVKIEGNLTYSHDLQDADLKKWVEVTKRLSVTTSSKTVVQYWTNRFSEDLSKIALSLGKTKEELGKTDGYELNWNGNHLKMTAVLRGGMESDNLRIVLNELEESQVVKDNNFFKP